MSSEDSSAQDPPNSRTYYFMITNNHTVAATIIKPGGAKETLSPGKTTGVLYANGEYNIVAPGTPDVTYFKVHYTDLNVISTEKGQLNGNFTVLTELH